MPNLPDQGQLAIAVGPSPFDSIRRTTGDGREYWSARDLMPLMGYSKWQAFEVPLSRASRAAANQGQDVETNFTGSRKVAAPGKLAQSDLHLSRFAAYLVAMNGDPNKPEVAVAQAYFAIQTRVAETAAPARELTLEEMTLQVVGKLQTIVEAQKQELAVAKPKAEAFDTFLNGKGLYKIGSAANIIGIGFRAFWTFLYAEKLLIKGGPKHKQPYANPKTKDWFAVKTYDQERTNGHAAIVTLLTPVGLEQIRLRAISAGLIPDQLTLVPVAPSDAIKAVSA